MRGDVIKCVCTFLSIEDLLHFRKEKIQNPESRIISFFLFEKASFSKRRFLIDLFAVLSSCLEVENFKKNCDNHYSLNHEQKLI